MTLQTSSPMRSNTIDIFRLLASFCIINLHINFGTEHEQFYGVVKLMCRWAVPFFFLIGGYFLQKSMEKSAFSAFKSTFTKILVIYIIASLIFLPFSHLSNGPFKLKYILAGDYFHLWYLPSMLVGVFVQYVLNRLKANIFIIGSTIFVFTVLILIRDPYSYFIDANPKAFPVRSLLSIPLMLTGSLFFSHVLFKKMLKPWLSVVFILIGAILQVIEVNHIDLITNRSIYDHQFLAGTFLFSVGVFIFSLTVKLNNEWLGQLGKHYSLFIYLYHPILIFFLHEVHYEITMKNIIFLLPTLLFLIVLFTGILLNNFLNKVFLTLNGALHPFPLLKMKRMTA